LVVKLHYSWEKLCSSSGGKIIAAAAATCVTSRRQDSGTSFLRGDVLSLRAADFCGEMPFAFG
jgi:hypothetical protein